MLAILLAAALAAAAPQQEEEMDEPGLVASARVSYGGAAYQAAYQRAQRYEDDGRIRAWHSRVFGPALNGQMVSIYRDCTPTGKAPDPFTLVISFNAGGQVDGVFVDRQTVASKCMAERFTSLVAPLPPVPDFAEEVRIVP